MKEAGSPMCSSVRAMRRLTEVVYHSNCFLLNTLLYLINLITLLYFLLSHPPISPILPF